MEKFWFAWLVCTRPIDSAKVYIKWIQHSESVAFHTLFLFSHIKIEHTPLYHIVVSSVQFSLTDSNKLKALTGPFI